MFDALGKGRPIAPWEFVLCESCDEYTLHKDLVERVLVPDDKGARWRLLSKIEKGPLDASRMIARTMCVGCERKAEDKERKALTFIS